MTQTLKPDPAVAAILKALLQTISSASGVAYDGCESIAEGRQNQAIGTILELDDLLKTATTLFNSAIALHRIAGKGKAAA